MRSISPVAPHSPRWKTLIGALWSKAVKMTRNDWNGPKPYSVLCSEHFDEESFEGGPLSLWVGHPAAATAEKRGFPSNTQSTRKMYLER